jgi:leucyl aminopeptidase (aminopeptidase T)
MRAIHYRFTSVVLGLVLVSATAFAASKATRKQQKQIAAKIVKDVAGVKEGEHVLIFGNVKDFDLVEDFMFEVIKAGGRAMPWASSSESSKRYYAEVPEKHDSAARTLQLKLIELFQVQIIIGRSDNPGQLKNVPVERLNATAKAAKPVDDLTNKLGIRRVLLGNGLYPTKATAKQYGLRLARLKKIFWGALNIDYAKLQESAKKVRGILENGKQIHITHKNGTDLKVGITKRPVKVSAGVITEADIKKGGAAPQVWLPAGEVMIVPEQGTAEGKLVINRLSYQGSEIRKLVLTFKAGKLQSVDAKKSPAFKRWKEVYDKAADDGKDEFSWVNFGINDKVKAPKGSKLQTWVMAGMVSCGVGHNLAAGGQNTSVSGNYGFLPGATVRVDDLVLVERGKLKI